MSLPHSRKICIVGPQGCQKTEAALALESRLLALGVQVKVAEEYVNSYIQSFGVPFNIFQQMFILQKQKQLEQKISEEYDCLITSVAPWSVLAYAQQIIQLDLPLVKVQRNGLSVDVRKVYDHALSEIMIDSIEDIKTFDYIFFIEKVASTKDDVFIADTLKNFLDSMCCQGVSYTKITGSLTDKVQQIVNKVGGGG